MYEPENYFKLLDEHLDMSNQTTEDLVWYLYLTHPDFEYIPHANVTKIVEAYLARGTEEDDTNG